MGFDSNDMARRFAAGEIIPDEYEKTRRILEG